MTKRQNAALVAAFVGLVALYVASNFPSLYADYLWFASLGYDSVFVKVILYRSVVFVVFALLAFVFLYTSYRVTVRNIRKSQPYQPSAWFAVGIVLGSVALGAAYSGAWETFLTYLNAEPFGTTDPYFGQPVSFYVFTLPAYNLVIGYLLLLTLLALAVAVGLYAYEFGLEEYEEALGVDELDSTQIEFDPSKFLDRVTTYAYGHLTSLLGVFLVLLSFNFFLSRYSLMFSESGEVTGVGATEAAVTSPALFVLALVAFVGGLACVANFRIRDNRVVYGALAAVLIVGVVGTAGAFLHQGYIVEPDEFNQEEEYLSNEIEFTRSAFALDRVEESTFDVSEELTREQVEDNPGTVENVKLWDRRPLRQTYNEDQQVRTYYEFPEIRTDRYDVPTENRTRQVMVSPREIAEHDLPTDTWVNRHLVYTHGMGLAMSPVSETDGQGLPRFYMENIPPESDVGMEMDPDEDQPRIYYGLSMESYNIVNTETPELDYPALEDEAETEDVDLEEEDVEDVDDDELAEEEVVQGGNVLYSYTGDGGVPLSSTFRQIAYAVRFGDHQIFFSDSVTTDSQIQMNRPLDQRVETIAPFLEYDDKPYPVAVDGEIKWIYDAYTTADGYPYSARTEFKGEEINYLRNSVKVVVDAYTGETTFYVFEDDDPVINTYRNIFPSLFEDADEMPDEVRENVRYPQDAFRTQAEVNLEYHMQDEFEFYQREDVWEVPTERLRGTEVEMEPYYIMMTLPGEEEPEFIQILPFVPQDRQNMIGWMAARSDEPHYGEIKSFQFSQQEVIRGPPQVDDLVDQDPLISESFTLWDDQGSDVIRGNLLVIPIDDTVMYVEPVFLEAQGIDDAIPQLQRAIVTHGDTVTMQAEFEDALDFLFGETTPDEVVVGDDDDAVGTLDPDDLQRLTGVYQEAEAALEEGNLIEYAERMEELGDELDEIDDAIAVDVNETAPTSPEDGAVDTPDNQGVDAPDEDELEG